MLILIYLHIYPKAFKIHQQIIIFGKKMLIILIKYLRPYWLELYQTMLYRRSTPLCYGNQIMHQLQLYYFKQFIQKYSKIQQPTFSLNWLTEISHEFMNRVYLYHKP